MLISKKWIPIATCMQRDLFLVHINLKGQSNWRMVEKKKNETGLGAIIVLTSLLRRCSGFYYHPFFLRNCIWDYQAGHYFWSSNQMTSGSWLPIWHRSENNPTLNFLCQKEIIKLVEELAAQPFTASECTRAQLSQERITSIRERGGITFRSASSSFSLKKWQKQLRSEQ